MSLGLDLRGGVHFMYEVDVQGAIDTGAGAAVAQDIRTQLRNERIPYLGSVVDGQTVRVTLRAGADVAAASKLIQGSDPGMTITNESVGDQVGADGRLHAASDSRNARTSRSSRTSRRCAIASTSSACRSRS